MATETLTLTLDGTAISTDITINDTSQSSSGEAVFSSVTQSGDSPQTWTVPTGITSISIQAISGGGGGAPGRYSYGSGGGGGGGSYISVIDLAVTPGEIFSFTIGKAGGGGAMITNSPFETVNSPQNYYPQSSHETAATNGGDTIIWYSGDPNYSGTSGPAILSAFGGKGSGLSNTGGAGGLVSQSTWANDNTTSIAANAGKAGRNAENRGSLYSLKAGGGGGTSNAGNGGMGNGDFHRSSGGYNYHKKANGGNGGGSHLYGGTNTGSQGADAPALGTGPYNYLVAGSGGNGGTATGSPYGGGGGGGAGGRIRAQTIISGSNSNTYYWFLGQNGSNGTQGAIRIFYGS